MYDDEYFPEYLWKERDTSEYTINYIENGTAPIDGTQVSQGDQALKFTFNGFTNFRQGDIIEIDGDITYSQFLDDIYVDFLKHYNLLASFLTMVFFHEAKVLFKIWARASLVSQT